MNKAEELRKKAAEHFEKEKESFDRCDTDGCVSQFCHSLNGNLALEQARIEENGGKDSFSALFDLQGNRVRAKLIKGKYGACWAFCDKNDNFTGRFISAYPSKESTMKKKGFVEGKELAPAKAKIAGSGTGLSGLATCRVVSSRTDKGYPEDAIVAE